MADISVQDLSLDFLEPEYLYFAVNFLISLPDWIILNTYTSITINNQDY